MRFLTTLSALIFLVFACNDKSTSPLRSKKANKVLLGAKKADSVVWKLVKTFDPYNKGYTILKDSSNYKYLSMLGDGSFREYDLENLSKGRWYLNREKSKIGFIYEVRNGTLIKEDLQQLFFRYQIDTLYQDTLVLAIQGRHGWVKQYYQIPHEAIESDSTNLDSIILPTLWVDSLAIDSSKNP